MDEHNNNDFGEESFAEKEQKQENSSIPKINIYNTPGQDPYNTAPNNLPGQGQSDPYSQSQQNPYSQSMQNPYSQPQQNPYAQPQQNPYAQPQQYQQDPYNQPRQNYDPYNQTQQGYDPYNQPYKSYDPYKQPQYDPYRQQPYNPYYQQPYSPYQQNGQYSTGMATASLVLGIISLLSALTFLNWIFPLLFLVPILGIVLGAVYKSKHYPVGKGLSTAGIITSSAGIVLSVVLIVVMAMFIFAHMTEVLQFLKDNSPEQYQMIYDTYHDMYPSWFENVTAVFRNLFFK